MTASAVSSFPSGICRLCTGEKSDLNSIFDKNLPMKVMKLADVKIAEGDGLPTTLCIDCESEIDRCLTFIEQMKWSDTKLREALQSPSKVMFEECNIKQEQIYPDFADETACDNETEQYRRNEYNAFEDDPDDPNEKPGTSEIKVDEDPCMIMKEESMIVDVNLPAPSSSSVTMTDLDERLPSNVETRPTYSLSDLLPEKSKVRYEEQYTKYEQWCKSQGFEDVADKKVLLAYFSHLSESLKPTTLWTFYSMIRSTILMKNKKDIKQYSSITAFLKKISKNYQPKQSQILSQDDIAKFLCEADDDKYLFMKVVMVVGLAGACKTQELLALTVDNVRDEHNYFHFVLPNAGAKNKSKQFVVPVGNIDGINLVEIIRKYVALRPINVTHDRFFIQYLNKKCTSQPVGKNRFGEIPKIIATFLKLQNPELYTVQCFKKSSKYF